MASENEKPNDRAEWRPIDLWSLIILIFGLILLSPWILNEPIRR